MIKSADKTSTSKTESELWLEQQSKRGSSMAEMLLKLVENFDPETRKQYIEMAHGAAKNALAAIENLSESDLEMMRQSAGRSNQNGR